MTDTELSETILGHVADSKASAPSMRVREAEIRSACRAASHEDVTRFTRVLQSLIPAKIRRDSLADPGFELTELGWLESRRRSDVDRIVKAILSSYRAATPNAGSIVLGAGDLRAQGIHDEDVGLVPMPLT